MDGLTALLARLVVSLRAALNLDICPGDWSWAVSALGVLVGLLPTVGLVAVAMLRRRIGSRYGPGESAVLIGLGLVAAGLLPLLAFTATGRIFSLAAAGDDVPGLTGRQVRSLGGENCLGLSQADYLGGYPVADSFQLDEPLRLGLATVLLVLFPLFATLTVAIQARLALRRGPRWPGRFFWLPTLALALLTADVAAGSSGHLWVGVTGGGFLGMVVLTLVGAPSREAIRRAQEPREIRSGTDGRPRRSTGPPYGHRTRCHRSRPGAHRCIGARRRRWSPAPRLCRNRPGRRCPRWAAEPAPPGSGWSGGSAPAGSGGSGWPRTPGSGTRSR